MQDKNYIIVNHGEFSVNYLSVGNGDSIFINLPDDKTVLIDVGVKKDIYANYIKHAVLSSKNKRIDYLIITHPSLDHIGNLDFLLDNVEIVNAFLPFIKENPLYTDYNLILQKLKDKNVAIDYAIINETIASEEYIFKFLSPLYPDSKESSYLDFNMEDFPSEEDKNNLSPIIYLEYAGVRFLFTGDAGILQEKVVEKLYKSNIYNVLDSNKITLEDIDFLKVSNHGGSGANTKDFLSLVKPKNAIISTGGNSFSGTNTLQKLIKSNEKVNIFRTDVDGATTISVKPNGLVNVETAKNK